MPMMGSSAPVGSTDSEANAWALLRLVEAKQEYQDRLKKLIEERVAGEQTVKNAAVRIAAAEQREAESAQKLEAEKRIADATNAETLGGLRKSWDILRRAAEEQAAATMRAAQERAQAHHDAAVKAQADAEKDKAAAATAWQAVKAREADLASAIEAANAEKAEHEAAAADLRNRVAKINALAG